MADHGEDEEMKRYEIENDLSTLVGAQRIRGDKKRMSAVQKLAIEQLTILKEADNG